jgi:hypothetical protein
MAREAMWTPWNGPGLEHLRLSADESVVQVDGLIIGIVDNTAFRARYVLRCDPAWQTRELRVVVLDDSQPAVHLLADGVGHWTTPDGSALPLLDGCIDVDLSATPFTNTLPIRRLGWQRGQSAELRMVYVELPSLHLSVERQRYTRLETPGASGRFRFESLPGGFAADLNVDQDGLVVDYPGLFRRVWSTSDNS